MSCLNNLALRVLEVFFRDARRVVHEHANKLNFCRFASSLQKISLFVGLRVTCIASLVFFTRFSLKKLMPCQTHRHISYSLFFTFASTSRTNGVTYAHLKNKKMNSTKFPSYMYPYMIQSLWSHKVNVLFAAASPLRHCPLLQSANGDLVPLGRLNPLCLPGHYGSNRDWP